MCWATSSLVLLFFVLIYIHLKFKRQRCCATHAYLTLLSLDAVNNAKPHYWLSQCKFPLLELVILMHHRYYVHHVLFCPLCGIVVNNRTKPRKQ